jgi:hypothetical protein
MTMTMTATTYSVHPAASLFPMMTNEEFQGLKHDIASFGQREPIIVWQDQLLDGRNRLRACEELGWQPNIIELDRGIEPWNFVISHNLHRRHLSESQRAMVAAKLANMRSGERTDLVPIDTRSSIADAAKQLKVGRASVARAKKVRQRGSVEVNAAVEQGQLPVSVAAEFVASVPDKADQTAIVADGADAVRVEVRKRLTKKQADEKRKGMNGDAKGGTIGDGEKAVCPAVASASESTPMFRWKSLLNVKRAFLSTRIKTDDDYRMKTLKRLIYGLAPHEQVVVMGWLTGSFKTPTISKDSE